MEQKKEVQDKIIKSSDNKVSEDELTAILRTVAPGTNLRSALDGALKTQKGALVVIENESMSTIIDGGFRINTKFTPQKFIELTKLDGAIILSKDMKKINYANVLLTPTSKIKTLETGTRHKAAERTAKQANTLVIAISERKHEINLFYKKLKYPLINTDELLRKTNEHIQILEKQRELFDKHSEKLDLMELRNYRSINHAINFIQKGIMIQKIENDIKKNTIELGKEGSLLKIRLKELTKDVENETDLAIKDYTQVGFKMSKSLFEQLSYEEILNSEHILKILGFEKYPAELNIKGWRILSKTSLHEAEIASLLNEAGSLGKSINSSLSFYSQLIGFEKAQILKEELSKIKINYSIN